MFRKCYLTVFLIFLTGLSCLAISQKNALHVDEVWSYGQANSLAGYDLDVEEGKTYEPAGDVVYGYLSASPDNTFNYRMVYENQKNDNHPPLYHILLHTICSLYPGTFLMPMPGRSTFCSWP